VLGKDGVQRINILGGSYFFDPNYIIVKANLPVELTVIKEAGIPHRFVINVPEAGMKVNESLSTVPKVIRFTERKDRKIFFLLPQEILIFKKPQGKGHGGRYRSCRMNGNAID